MRARVGGVRHTVESSMNYRLLFFLILFLCNRSTAQEEVPDGVVIMINPVRWGTIVYVKSEELTKRKLLNEFKVLNREVFDGCHLENGNYESWYCNKGKLVLQ